MERWNRWINHMDKSLRGLKQEINEVKDLVQEILRRLGKLEFRGKVQYGEMNSISQKSVSVDIHLDRMVNGEFIRNDMKKKQDNWDKLKREKIDIPNVKVKPNRKIINVKNKKDVMNVIKNDKRFDVNTKKIDEMEWLNLLKEIRDGIDAFQRGNFTMETTREQVSSVILNRVKKWLEDKEL